MHPAPRLFAAAVVAAALVVTLALPAAAGAPERVVANITTDDVNRAAMAVKFTHAAMKQKGLQATLFFNLYGVRLVNRHVPSPIYPTGDSIHQLLASFMADGGKVLACPMCMKNVGGMTNADLLQGVEAAPGEGLDAVTAEDTLVLSY